MPIRRIATVVLVPVALAAALLLCGLALMALQAAMAKGGAEAGLMAWMLAFVVGVPLALPLLALAHRATFRIWERKSRERDNLPPSPAHRGFP